MAKEINQPIERRSQLDATVGNAPVGEAFTRLASRETVLGELGAQVAQQSANALSARFGTLQGEEPHGDLLPAITEADKHFKDAYVAQSHNVLSLQLNSMMTQSQNELEALDKLTPEVISQYSMQTSEAAKDILANAPTEVRNQLGGQINNNIVSTSGVLTRKMIADNKQVALSQMKVVDKQTDESIINAATYGKVDEAHKIYEQKLSLNEKQLNSGMMSPLEKYTSDTSAKLSYYSGISNSRALEARAQGDEALAEYLSSLGDLNNKPADLSVSEWNSVATNTLALMRARDQFDQSEQNIAKSELDLKFVSGSLGEQDLLDYLNQDKISLVDVNQYRAKLIVQQNSLQKKNATNDIVYRAMTGDEVAFSQLSTKEINNAYQSAVDSIKTANPDLPLLAAETNVATTAKGKIPQFVQTVSQLATSTNPNNVLAAYSAFNAVRSVNPNNVLGISENAYNVMTAYEAFRLRGDDDVTAINNARLVTLKRKPEEQKIIDDNWKQVVKDNYKTQEQVEDLANDILETDNILGGVVVSNKVLDTLGYYTRLIGGDVETAKIMTKKTMDLQYGETMVNGTPMTVRTPLEKAVNLGDNSSFFIQEDIVNHLQTKAFPQYKDAYDRGEADFYYRVKDAERFNTDRVLFETQTNQRINARYKEVQNEIYAASEDEERKKELRQESRELSEAISTSNKFLSDIRNNQSQVIIEKVYRHPSQLPKSMRTTEEEEKEGIIEAFPLAVEADDSNTLTSDSIYPVSSFYNFAMLTANGNPVPLTQLDGSISGSMNYYPNVGKIRESYTKYFNTVNPKPSANQMLDAYIKTKKLDKAK